jgi:DNA-binding winged helix-turn-helix (wHTH) protein
LQLSAAGVFMQANSLRFDDFELDFSEGQLQRNGLPVKLENIPLRLLLLLAENKGNLVSREEIIEKLWGKNAFLDAEQGINTAIRKIRLALNDSPDQPRYVQTVVGRGYRFVAIPTREEQLVANDIQSSRADISNGNTYLSILPTAKDRLIIFKYRNFSWAVALLLLIVAMLLATLALAVHKDSQQSALAVHQVSELSRTLSNSHESTFGVLTNTFPVEKAIGTHIRYSGYIKTKNITRGWAGLWWRVDGASGVLILDNMQDRGVTGTTDWKLYEINLTVPSNAKNINFGTLLTGDGEAWFDNLAINVNGKPYTDKSLFDLSFDSNTIKSLYAGGIGYRVKLDKDVFRDGNQSLSMQYLASTSN